MSGLEVLVVVVGALAGYWLVNFFFKSPPSVAPEAPSPVPPAPARGREWFVVLGVPEDAPEAEIRQAYKHLMSMYHPDKVASMGPEIRELANEKAQAITAAYRQGMTVRGQQP